MSLIKIKQIDQLQTTLDDKATTTQLSNVETSIETAISTESVARENGDKYLEATTNPQSTNNVSFGSNINWLGGTYDINVYVNGTKIDNGAYTHTQGTNGNGDSFVFNPSLVGYDVETTDEVNVIGNIA